MTTAVRDLEAVANRVCALTGIRLVRRDDARRAIGARTCEGRAAIVATLRKIADDLERDL